jgi:hypothetical protein
MGLAVRLGQITLARMPRGAYCEATEFSISVDSIRFRIVLAWVKYSIVALDITIS